MSNIGKITVIVDDFVANPSPDPCEPYCTLSSPSAITITDDARNGNGTPQIGYDPIFLNLVWAEKKNTAGHIDLEFSFVSSAGTPYTATGAYFLAQVQGNQDPSGRVNFSKINGSAGTIRFRNKWKHKGRGATWPQTCPAWELYVQIQNAAGDTGWIDPGVENTEDL